MNRSDVEAHFRDEIRPVAAPHAWRTFLRSLVEAGLITQERVENWKHSGE